MNCRLILLAAALVVAGCMPPPPPTKPTRTAPEIGCWAPELEAEDVDGEKIVLSKYRGKVVVLDFWATWCPPCRSMIPSEKALVARMQGRPFVLIGVSADHKRETLTKFIERNGMPWPDIFDGYGGPIAKKWEVEAYPTIVVIDANGVIVQRLKGATELDQLIEPLVRESEAH
jgi:thiol-disulfide isomerase/thioredoxin